MSSDYRKPSIPKTPTELLSEAFQAFCQEACKVADGATDLNTFRKKMHVYMERLPEEELTLLLSQVEYFGGKLRSNLPEMITRVWQNKNAILSKRTSAGRTDTRPPLQTPS